MEAIKYKEPVYQKEFEFKIVPVEDVEIPPFQREVSEALVKKLTNSIVRLGFLHPLVCYEKDGKYYVVDGQHRFLALKKTDATTVPIVVVDPDIAQNIMYLNTEKSPTIKERSIQAYKLFQEFLKEDKEIKELELAQYIEQPYFLTFGFTIEEYLKNFPASFFESILNKGIDFFFDLPLEEAAEERRKRAKVLIEVNEELNRVYEALEIKNPLIKKEIMTHAFQSVYGKRVRKVEDDFFTTLSKVKEALKTVSKEDIAETALSKF